jgi:hypothetical protein
MDRLSDSNIFNTRQNELQSRETPDCVPLHLNFDAGVVVLLTMFASTRSASQNDEVRKFRTRWSGLNARVLKTLQLSMRQQLLLFRESLATRFAR